MTTCLRTPVPTIPTLPAPFSLSVPDELPLPSTPGVAILCCKLPPVPLPPIPIPIPAILLNSALVAILNAAIATVTGYLHSLPLSCPLE